MTVPQAHLHSCACIPPPSPRLLLPYERHIKGEQDKPLPLAKPRKQEGGQDKASGAKAKTVGAKKLKGPNTQKPESKKERGETVKGQEQSQVSSPDWILSCSKFNFILIFSCFPVNASSTILFVFELAK